MKIERFRAYTASEGSKSKWFANDVTGEKRRQIVDTWPTEDIAFEGKLKDGTASFDAGKTPITRVVFLGGPADAEVVLGEAAVDSAGEINVTYVEPSTDESNWSELGQ